MDEVSGNDELKILSSFFRTHRIVILKFSHAFPPLMRVCLFISTDYFRRLPPWCTVRCILYAINPPRSDKQYVLKFVITRSNARYTRAASDVYVTRIGLQMARRRRIRVVTVSKHKWGNRCYGLNYAVYSKLGSFR